MEGIMSGLDAFRTILAVSALACHLLTPWERSRMTKTSIRNTNTLLALFALLALATLIDVAVSFRLPNNASDTIPLAAVIYSFGIVIQLDSLWKFQEQPAWYDLGVSWGMLTIFEVVSLAEYSTMLHYATVTPALISAIVTSSFKVLLLTGLISTLIWTGSHARQKGYTAMPTDDENIEQIDQQDEEIVDRGSCIDPVDQTEADGRVLDDETQAHVGINTAVSSDDATSKSGNSDSDGSAEEAEGVPKAMLLKLVDEEIAEAGSKWQWIKQFSIFWPWMWPQGQRLLQLRTVLAMAVVLIETVIDLFMPWLQGVLIESVIRGATRRSMAPVWVPLVATLVLGLITSSVVAGTVKELLWLDVDLYRRQKKDNDIYGHLMKLDAAYHDDQHPSDILEAVNLGSQITESLDFIAFSAIPEIITLIGAGIHVLSSYGPRVALVLAYVMLLYALNTRRSIANVMPSIDKNRAANQMLQRHFSNGVRAWTTVARHNQTNHETSMYHKESSMLNVQRRLTYITGQMFTWCSGVILQCGYIAAMLLVIFQIVLTGTTKPGSLVAFTGYWSLLLSPLLFIIDTPRKMVGDIYAASRLRRILVTTPNIAEGAGTLEPHQRNVIFHNVKICFGGKTLFDDLNLDFPGGKTTAIIGPSGVGKSTILDHILRMRDPAAGSITIGGTDVAELSWASLRTHVGIMPQVSSSAIFKESVLFNVRYVQQLATDKEVYEACRKARLHDEILARDGGYSSDASTLSGGQLQRLLWARVFLLQPRIILLDEPTASLDGANAAAIKEIADLAFANHTVIMVSHLMSVVKEADKIIVLGKGGKVVQAGTHEELLEEKNSDYSSLWSKHLGKKEVEVPVEDLFN